MENSQFSFCSFTYIVHVNLRLQRLPQNYDYHVFIYTVKAILEITLYTFIKFLLAILVFQAVFY